MATPLATTYTTTTAEGQRQSLSDRIAKVDPIETPLYSMADKVTADSISHEWLEWEVPAAVALDPQAEGEERQGEAGGDYMAPTNPVRYNNATEIASRQFSVSGTLEAVAVAGKSPVNQQIMNFGLELRRDVERLLLNNAAKKDTEPRVNAGLPAWSDSGDGSAALTGTPSHVSDDVELAALAQFEAGIRPDVVLMLPGNKKLFSASTKAGTAPTAFQVESAITDRKAADIPGAVSVYLSDVGALSMVADQYMDATAQADFSFILDSRKLAVAEIQGRAFSVERLGKSGDAHQVMLIWEGCLEARSPKSIAAIV